MCPHNGMLQTYIENEGGTSSFIAITETMEEYMSGNNIARPFVNKAKVEAVYYKSGIYRRYEGESNKTITDVIKVEAEKHGDKDEVKPGESIKYTVTVKNRSSVRIEGVSIADEVPEMTQIEDWTIVPAPNRDESLDTGLMMGDIEPGGEIKLEYLVAVDEDASGRIANAAEVSYSYNNITDAMFTNEVRIPIYEEPKKAQAELTSRADKSMVTRSGEEVEYTLELTNTGDVMLKNVMIYDRIPEGMNYRACSTTVRGNPPFDANPEFGIVVGDLEVGETATIGFAVKVLI